MSNRLSSPIAIGSILAVVAVAAVLGVTFARSGGLAARSRELPGDAHVMIAVVVPNVRGVAAPVAITLYAAFPSSADSESVDPATRATVSGTSAGTLRAVYPFGGGAALAAGVAQASAIPAPYWVVVDESDLQRLAPNATIRLHLDQPIDVFDGVRFSSFPSGTVDVPARQVPALMAGVERLSVSEAKLVRAEVASDVLQLVVAQAADTSGLTSDLTPAQLSAWLARMRAYAPASR